MNKTFRPVDCGAHANTMEFFEAWWTPGWKSWLLFPAGFVFSGWRRKLHPRQIWMSNRIHAFVSRNMVNVCARKCVIDIYRRSDSRFHSKYQNTTVCMTYKYTNKNSLLHLFLSTGRHQDLDPTNQLLDQPIPSRLPHTRWNSELLAREDLRLTVTAGDFFSYVQAVIPSRGNLKRWVLKKNLGNFSEPGHSKKIMIKIQPHLL